MSRNLDEKEKRTGAQNARKDDEALSLAAKPSALPAQSDSEQEDILAADEYEDYPREMIPGFAEMKAGKAEAEIDPLLPRQSSAKYVAYTVKLPADQLAALQNIWLELKRLYGTHSPDKSGMIQAAVQDWLKRWDGPDKQRLLRELLEIREDTRRRQYKK